MDFHKSYISEAKSHLRNLSNVAETFTDIRPTMLRTFQGWTSLTTQDLSDGTRATLDNLTDLGRQQMCL